MPNPVQGTSKKRSLMTSHASLFYSSGPKRPVIKLILTAGMAAFVSPLVHATAYTWTPTAAATYSWDNPTSNWTSGFPNAIGDTANIGVDFAGAQTINLNQAIKVGSLTINDTGVSSDSAITIAPGTSGTLTMQVSSGSATLTSSSLAAINIISAPIVFASDTTIALPSSTSSSTPQGLTFSGGFSGSGNITVTGGASGTGVNLLTLITLNNSSYTGNWILNAATSSGNSQAAGGGILIDSDANLGAVPSSPSTNITVNVATATRSSVLQFTGAVTLNANRNILLNSGAILMFEQISLTTSTVAGVISGAGGIATNSNSSSKTVKLSGTNTYTGATNVSGGVLQAGSTSAFGNNSAVTMGASSTAKLDLNNFNNSIGSLAGGGTGQGAVTLGSATLTTGGLNTSTSYVGAISGTGGFTKVGTGAQTLGGANTYTGTTTLNGGIITADVADVASTSGALGKGGNITFTGGTLQYTANSAGSDYSSRIKNSTSVISVDTNSQAVAYASAIANTNNGGLTKSGAGTLTLNGANLYTGQTTISAGTLALGASGTIAGTSGVNLGTTGSPGTFDLTLKTSGFTLSSQSLTGVGTVNIGTATLTLSNGTLAAGNGAGIIAVTGNLALTGTTASTFELGTNTATSDQVNVSGSSAGNLTYGGTLNVTFLGSTTAGTYSLFDFLGQSGSFTSFSIVGTALTPVSTTGFSGTNLSGFDYNFTYATGDLVIAVAAIPEPSTYAVIFGALVLAGCVVRRSHKRRA